MNSISEEIDTTGPASLWSLLKMLQVPWWRHVFLFFVFLLKMAPQLLLPVLIAESIRVAGSGLDRPWDHLVWIYGIYLVFLVLNIPLHSAYVRQTSQITRTLELRLRSALVRRLQQLSMSFHSSRESGRLQSKVLRDVDEIVRLVEWYLLAGLGAILSLLFAFGVTLFREPVVALGYLIATPLCLGLVHGFRGAMSRRNDELRKDFETMSQRMSEMIQMVPVTRAHGAEAAEIDLVHECLVDVRNRGRRVDAVNAYFGSSAFVVFMGTVVVITAGVTWLVTEGRLGIDKIALYAALFQMVVGSVQQLLNMLPQASKALAAQRSVREILTCPDLEENEGKLVVETVRGDIDFRDVSYSYGDRVRSAVEGFTLHVPAGTCVAFVGESGSGKSTLMQLAIGFLRAQRGEILLDGLPLNDIDMRSWRRQIAMVPQQTILFSGTVRDNIGYGLHGVTDESIWQAIETANLREVVAALPLGLDTIVGENGVKLSGGQRQRLAIARAVVRNPRVIILDEATSALDVVSEREVQIAITNLIQGRTTFIVAHRLSTVRQADLIVVMKDGRLLEMGPPVELEAAGGAFSRLKALQAW